MKFADRTEIGDTIELLQRSLERGRLAHAYLFAGGDLDQLEAVARILAKTLNCENPQRRSAQGLPVDCCDLCPSCRKIDRDTHPDVTWLRPESKLRQIRIEPLRELLQRIYLKPTQAKVKVAFLSAADRLNTNAANAFLKTLEEPPADSVLLLLSTEPDRILETIRSRCQRLNFEGGSGQARDPVILDWLQRFGAMAAGLQASLLGRYRLLSLLMSKLAEIKEATESALTSRSPLQAYDEVDGALKEKWEDELAAGIEAEYRRRRADLLVALQWWLRDVWLETLKIDRARRSYPELAETATTIARRLTPAQAMANLELIERTIRLLASTVQEALTLEVSLLKLQF